MRLRKVAGHCSRSGQRRSAQTRRALRDLLRALSRRMCAAGRGRGFLSRPSAAATPDPQLFRRPLGLYLPTRITGISWRTGHHYTQEQANHLMGTRERHEHRGPGLEIRFSRPVLASTIRHGVLETWAIEGGRGSRARIYHKDGEFVDKPREGTVDRIFYRDTTDETLEPGDRLLVILRTDFILDECCRAVDGEHIGGSVPPLHEHAEHHRLRAEHEHQ